MMSAKTRIQFSTMAIISLIAACATDPAPLTHHQKQFTDVKPVMKEQTTQFNHQVLSGAAYAGEEYAAVLAPRRNLVDQRSNQVKEDMIPTNAADAVKQALASQSGHSPDAPTLPAILTIYERQSWSRYCGKDKMTEADVRYIDQVGPHQIPDEYRMGCNDIAVSIDQYLSAWKKQCAGVKIISDDEKMLLERTRKPRSIKCG